MRRARRCDVLDDDSGPGSRRSIVRGHSAVKRTFEFVAALMFLALAVIVYGHVFSDGLCCADDSTNAIVANNLAFGKGYSNSIPLDGNPGLRQFDPRITTAPAL